MKDTKRLFELCEGVDAVLVVSQKNRRYFTGFDSTAGYLFLSREAAPLFITDSRYGEMALHLGQEGVELVVCSGAAIIDTLNARIASSGVKTLGYEDTELTVCDFERLKAQLNGVEFIAIGAQINLVRQIKTPDELEYIAKAQSITDRVFKHMTSFIKPDMSEIDLAIELECQIRRFGGDGLAFDTIIASGENSSKPHAHPTMRKIKAGDPITMDFGAKYNGYCSDMTRTVFMGKPDNQMKNIYNVVLKAQTNTLSTMKAGMTGKQLDALAREVITANGFGEYFQHSTGHSLGMDIHESPNLSPLCETVFLPNMMGTVEPGIYIAGQGGVRIEDMVVFTEDGIRNFTASPKDIASMIL